jgi:LPS-assembly protein
MTIGRALRLGFATGLIAAALVSAAEPPAGPPAPAEVRVLSVPGRPTTLVIQAQPDTRIEDKTPGAHPSSEAKGPASVGETFSDEVSFVIRGATPSRPMTIDVEDALVSSVKLFPDPAGTQVVVFIRQPVSYSIARPSASGAIEIALRPRTVAAPLPPTKPGAKKPPRPKPAEGSDQVAVDAAELSYDQQGDVLIARGGVTLTRGATTLRADEVRYDRRDSVAQARGHVVLVDPEATIEGDAASLDLDDETGSIDDVQGEMRQSPYRLTADHVEKRGGPCYGIRDGVFTTCRCGGVERPPWSIAAESTDVTVGGVGIAKHAKFRINDTPVLYFPYLLFPANTDRQTGFLMPQLGYSNRRGFVYQQPFYWAIDKSSDLTLTGDLETAARIGLIGEYRYDWSRTSRGAFTGGIFNEHIGGNEEHITSVTTEPTSTPENRWIVAGRHRTLFPGGQVYLDVLRVSDDNFLREIRAFSSNVSSDIQIRSQRYTRSRLGVVDTWQGSTGTGGVVAEATAYQDLIDPQRFSLDRLPRLAAEHSYPFFDGLVVGRLPGEIVNFQREKGYDGMRFDLAPEMFVPFRWSRYLFGSVRSNVRETAYPLTDDDQVVLTLPGNGRVNNVLRDLDTSHTREIAEVQGRLATEIAKVYSFPYLGLDRIRHSIEPEVQYLFVPQVGRDIFQRPPCDQLPNPRPGVNCIVGHSIYAESYLFDDVDAINRRNFFSYGLTTRILGRFGGAPEEPAEAETEPTPAEKDDGKPTLVDSTDDDDEEDADEMLGGVETIDPDTIPQGLPAGAIPPFVGKHPPRSAPTAGASRELIRASILHGYDVSRELSDGSHVSALDGLVRVTPVDWLGLSYNTTFDVQAGRMLAQSIGMIVREPWWSPPAGRPSFQSPTSIGIGYQFINKDVNRGLPANSLEEQLFTNANPTSNLSGSVYVRLGEYVGFGFLGTYQLTDSFDTGGQLLGPRFIERDYFLRLTSPCACWALQVGVQDRSDTGETSARVQLFLYGLGSFGQGPAHGGFAALPGLQTLGLRRPGSLGSGY